MKSNKINSIYFVALVLLAFGCTNLEVEELDSRLIQDETGQFTGVDPAATLNTAYADLRAFADQANTYALHEVTSDELLVPTRGTDWGDNGLWRTLHQHTWDATHPHVLTSWNQLNSNIFRLNQMLAPESAPNAEQAASAKFLRAYNMYLLLDLFGQIPFREVNEGIDVDPRVLSASEAFDFINQELNDAIPDLPATGPGDGTRFASQAAAHFLRAKLFLNKHIFLETGSAAAEDMNNVIESVNAIQAAGFELEDDYFGIFEASADTETIFWTDAEWGNRIWNGLHYNQQTPDNTAGGWNGFSTTAEFYALFEGPEDTNAPNSGQEERRGYVQSDGSDFGIGYGFLVGQQYGPEGNQLTDRAGRPLVYTPDYPDLVGNSEANGIRIIKYHPANGGFTNYYILFRYADAHLMKAEAILRGGSASEDALSLVNELREKRDASPLTGLSLDEMLDERGRELYIEGWRRNDQIRFGTYTSEWALKAPSGEHRTLFPVPATAVATNPNLEQNPGY